MLLTWNVTDMEQRKDLEKKNTSQCNCFHYKH